MSKEQEEAQAPSIKLTRAFKKQLGTNANRTVAQKILWDELRRLARMELPSFVANHDTLMDPASGQMKNIITYDPLKAALTDGMKMLFCQMNEYCEFKENKTPNKPKVKK